MVEARRSKDTSNRRRGDFDSPSYAQLNPDTEVFGRAAEISALASLLVSDKYRLITLTGMGGVGKTRIAMAAIEKVRTERVEVCRNSAVVSLDTLRNPDLVISTIAQNLRFGDDEGGAQQEILDSRLRDYPFLLYLDNFEHLLDATPLITSLLLGYPNLTILITSRIPLRLRLEWPVEVEPLELPSADEIDDMGRLGVNPSVAMFIERSKGRISLSEENAKTVAQICRRLDGLPLALELAAARVGYFQSAEALLAGLSHSLDVLTQGERDAPDRQQSLRATIGWSYRLLSEEEQVLFRALGVFRGAVALDVIESVAHCVIPRSRIKPGLESLVEQRLVRVFIESETQLRYAMLETIRAYCEELFEESEWRYDLEWSHAEYYLSLVESFSPPPRRGGFGDRVSHDGPGLRAAVGWLLEMGVPNKATRLLSASFSFWRHPDNLAEAKEWLTKTIQHPGIADENMVEARRLSARIADYTEDFLQARKLLDTNLAWAREMSDDACIANALAELGYHVSQAGLPDEMWGFLRDALEIRERSGNTFATAELHADIAYFRAFYGDLTQAREHSVSAAAILRDDERVSPPISSINSLISPALGVYNRLRSFNKQTTNGLRPLGILDIGQEAEIPYILGLFCVMAVLQSPPEITAQVYGALDGFLIAHNMTWIGSSSWEGRAINDILARMGRGRVSESEWSQHAAKGSTLPLVEAIRLAIGETIFNDGSMLEKLDVSTRSPRAGALLDTPGNLWYIEGSSKPLTTFEITVIQSLLDGKSRKQIARELGMSDRGVDYYTSKILDRILKSGDEGLINSIERKSALIIAFARKHNIGR